MPPDVRARLETHCELIRRYSGRLRLVSGRDLDRLWDRHVLDSLKGLGLLDSLRSMTASLPCVDVGSGAGFPGVSLAAARPAITWRLLEPKPRRAAFLEEVVRVLELDCEVLVARAQEAATLPHLRGRHALAVARALGPPTRSFGLLLPLVAPGGRAALWTTAHTQLPPEAEELEGGLAIIRATTGPTGGG